MKLFDSTEVAENNRNDRDEPVMQHDEVKTINIQTNKKRPRGGGTIQIRTVFRHSEIFD